MLDPLELESSKLETTRSAKAQSSKLETIRARNWKPSELETGNHESSILETISAAMLQCSNASEPRREACKPANGETAKPQSSNPAKHQSGKAPKLRVRMQQTCIPQPAFQAKRELQTGKPQSSNHMNTEPATGQCCRPHSSNPRVRDHAGLEARKEAMPHTRGA